jgi:altronate hydrolase
MDFVRLDRADTVVTAVKSLAVGMAIEDITVRDAIPSGHKIATQAMGVGDPVRKYAQIIGYVSCEILPGDHVHTHNVEFRNTDTDYEFSTDLRDVAPATTQDYFMGYRRENGAVGTRNYIAIVTSVNCSATAARMIADHFTADVLAEYPNVDGVAAFVHGTGCGMADSGDGFEALQRVMWGYAKHPNHAGVLMVGLGCEMNQIDWLLEAYGLKQSETFHTMNIQKVAGLRQTVELGIAKIKAMLPIANQARREECPASHLMVALQCGGSDAWSGVTANPALGYACDLLTAQGATGVLAETPEIYGAEHLLTRRAATPEVGARLVGLIKWWEDYTARNNGSMDNNPSPGNKAGGLTTILEKSLGAPQKAERRLSPGCINMPNPCAAAGSPLWTALAMILPLSRVRLQVAAIWCVSPRGAALRLDRNPPPHLRLPPTVRWPSACLKIWT